jgi:integrase
VVQATANWIAALHEDRAKHWLADRVAAVGLISPRERSPQAAVTLGKFIDDYIASRTDVKPLTIRHLKDARRNLVAFFGENKPLAEITPGDADDFRRNLLQRLGDNTVRRQCGRAKQFFRAALRKRLIQSDPFGDMKGCGVRANKSREYFITRDMAQRVLDAYPDGEWRLMFVLARFGGLRTPSETLKLRWADVDWERARFTVHSTKTEHHEGGGVRIVPIFPELLPYLETQWDAAPEGAEFVIACYRDPAFNPRTQLERIIAKAGLTPWPKLWHNLRASRATELVADHPAHVAAHWLGHSTLVAQKHYWQVTDLDYDRASGAERCKIRCRIPPQRAEPFRSRK